MRKNVVVFAPHPDDETLGCGGTIVKKIKEGCGVYIIFMTDGRHSHSVTISRLTSHELKEIRKEEAKRVGDILGLRQENLIFLDFEDGTLETNKKKTQEKVVKILKELTPVEVYYPHKKDPQKDHRATNSIVENSIKLLSLHPVKYQYTVWTFKELIFKDSSYLPRILTYIKNVIHNPGKHDVNEVHVNISEFLPLKIRAMEEYKSQVTVFFAKQKKPILESSFLDNFFRNDEVFIKSN